MEFHTASASLHRKPGPESKVHCQEEEEEKSGGGREMEPEKKLQVPVIPLDQGWFSRRGPRNGSCSGHVVVSQLSKGPSIHITQEDILAHSTVGEAGKGLPWENGRVAPGSIQRKLCPVPKQPRQLTRWALCRPAKGARPVRFSFPLQPAGSKDAPSAPA